MNASQFEHIRLKEQKSAGWLIIDREEKLNALSLETVQELKEAMDAYIEREDIHIIVIRGEGSKAFSAGADISEFAERDAHEQMQYIDAIYDLYDSIDIARTPVIGAINGIAFGGGAELALSCDMRIATETASFCEAEINIGLIPGAKRLLNLVGEGVAMELCLTGREVKADEANELGIFNRVVSDGELENEISSIIDTFDDKTAISLELTKDTVLAARNNSLEDATMHNYANFYRAFEAPETQDKIERFLKQEDPG